MKPVVVTHQEYQESVLTRLRQYYSGSPLLLLREDWPLLAKFWITDLSGVTALMRDSYGFRGPKPRDPSSMLRSFLLLLSTKPEMSITGWVSELKRIPLYAILSGFEPGCVPGIGTFYDFFARLWNATSANIRSPIQRRGPKSKKGRKGQKADTSSPGRVKRLVNWMKRHSEKRTQLPIDRLFGLFQSEFLAVSATLGLLGDTKSLAVAGDGTPVETAAYPRSKPACNCRAQGLADCNHPRIYSQPDCDVGWDSSREKYFDGYHMYTLTAANSPHDLPLYQRLYPASRHDAVSFVLSSVEFMQRFTLGTVKRVLLDSAHDAKPIYDLLLDQDINPLIDLNLRTSASPKAIRNLKVSYNGRPICAAGLEMKHHGSDRARMVDTWLCPRMTGRTTHNCPTPCTTARYGKTCRTYRKDNPRLFTDPPRDSDQWNLLYKRRTSVERTNKREKRDYKLQSGQHRSSRMWYMRTYGIMMCQHIDAWYVHRRTELEELMPLFPHLSA